MAEAVELQPSGVPPHPSHAERYPWHARAWSAVTRDLARLPHALLLHGQPGLGKGAFAWRLAQTLVCVTPRDGRSACGECTSCRLFRAGTHPDLLAIGLEEESRQITVDQIRSVGGFLALRPHTASRKVVIVAPADAMNLAAANSLLKVLEEPPAGSVLLLVSSRVARLPATIRSRCAAVAFGVPAREEAVAWLTSRGIGRPDSVLEVAGGAPLAALELDRSGGLAEREEVLRAFDAVRSGREDPIRCAALCKATGAARCLAWIQDELARRIATAMTGDGEDKNQREIKLLFELLDHISQSRSLLETPLDETLLLEDVMIRWSRIPR